MSNRFNLTNNGGVVTIAGGNMPASTFTNQHQPVSRANPGKTAAPTTVGSTHAIEVGGDGGIWDTVSGAPVLREKTNIDAINV